MHREKEHRERERDAPWSSHSSEHIHLDTYTHSLKSDISYSHAALSISWAPSTAAASRLHEFISSPLRGDQMSPVHYVCPHRINWNWKCYVTLWWASNRLALSNQACEAIANPSWVLEVWARVWVAVRSYWGSGGSWEQCRNTSWLIIAVFFGFGFMSCSGWGNGAQADQIRCTAGFAQLNRNPPISPKYKTCQEKATLGASLSEGSRSPGSEGDVTAAPFHKGAFSVLVSSLMSSS